MDIYALPHSQVSFLFPYLNICVATKGQFGIAEVDEISCLYCAVEIRIASCLINCVVVVAVSLKIRIYTFDKFYYESAVLLYNDQNRHKFSIACYF